MANINTYDPNTTQQLQPIQPTVPQATDFKVGSAVTVPTVEGTPTQTGQLNGQTVGITDFKVGSAAVAPPLTGSGAMSPTEMKPLPVGEQTPYTPSVNKVGGSATRTPEEQLKFDQSQGTERQNKIIKNLEEGLKNSPGLFSSQEEYRKAYDYETADAVKKQILDAYWKKRVAPANQQQQKQEQVQAEKVYTQDDLFNMVVSGQDTTQFANTPAGQQAQGRLDAVSKYRNASSDVYLNGMKSGDIIEGSKKWNDMLKANGGVVTPAMSDAIIKYQAIKTAKDINRTTASDIGQAKTEPEPTQVVSDKIVAEKGLDYAKTFSEMVTQNPEIMQRVSNLKNFKTQIAEKELQKQRSIEQIKKDYPYLSKSAQLRLASQNNADLDNELRDLYSKAQIEQSDLAYFTDLAKTEFDYKVKQNESDIGYSRKVQDDLRDFSQQKELANMQFENQTERDQALAKINKEEMAYKARLGLATNQKEFEQKLAQEAQIAKDPVQGVKSIIKRYTDIGITPRRSEQEILDEVNKQIGEGKTLGEALTYLSEQFQGGDQYKSYIASQQPTERQTQDWSKLDDNTLYNQKTGEFKTRDGKNVSGSQPGTIDMTKALGIGTITGYGGEYDNFQGLDIDGTKGQPIQGLTGTVIKVGNNPKTYGNFVVIDNGDGTYTRYSHLDRIDVEKGDDVSGKSIGTIGNSGNIIAMNGGDGSHIDITMFDDKGNNFSSKEVEQYLKAYKGPQLPEKTGYLVSLGEFMKDNQETGPGYSNDDVKKFDAKIDKYIKKGDEKGMAIAYRGMLMKDKDFKQEFDNTQKFVTALDSVQNLINEYEEAGKSTNALKSLAEKIARGLGVTTDTALAQMQTQMGFTLANYIRSISGTAASDTEVQRLMGNMAQIGNVKDLNTAIISQAKNNGLSGLKSMIETRMYGMPEDLKLKVFNDIYKESPQLKRYKTDQGEYTEDEIMREIEQKLSSGQTNMEEVRYWLKKNNIPFNG